MRSLILLFFFTNAIVMAQENKPSELPFKAVPEAASEYDASTVVIRMIQGAGFRYYWATEGLTASDFDFKPSESGKSTWETLEHTYGLSQMIRNTAFNEPNIRPMESIPKDWSKLRADTLRYLEAAAKELEGKSAEDLAALNVIFERGGKQSAFPLWNLINGPISDLIYHTGQLVSFRRSNENPIPKGVNVFLGRKNE
jgi:hypothetical protein